MIYLGSDHRGYEMKEKIKAWLTEWKFEYVDCGPSSYQPLDDYPDYVAIVAEKVAQDPIGNVGIVLGATGQGEAMVANRRRGIRAVVYYAPSDEIITLSREHNASNILSLAASYLSEDQAKHAIELWFKTPFSAEERHVRRIGKIDPQ